MIRTFYGILGWGFKQLSGLFRYWLLFLVVAFFLSPVGPHLRWEYQYRDLLGRRHYVSCTYLGSRGFVFANGTGNCPFIIILDSRQRGG